jgi:hypothetical protein
MILTDPGFPFTPGSARNVRDPAAEAERLAEARKAAETVLVRRADLDVLLALASLCIAAFRDGTVTLPDGTWMRDAEEVLARHGQRH